MTPTGNNQNAPMRSPAGGSKAATHPKDAWPMIQNIPANNRFIAIGDTYDLQGRRRARASFLARLSTPCPTAPLLTPTAPDTAAPRPDAPG